VGVVGVCLQAAISRLKRLHSQVQESSWLPAATWSQMAEDFKTLLQQAQQQQKLQQMVEVNIQRHEQAVFKKLGQLQSNASRVSV